VSIRAVTHFTWQVLRAAARSKKPLTGQELRVTPSRKSKDGTFLDELVTAGLLEVVGLDPLPVGKPSREPVPVPFRKRYKLTAKGEHAAEFGEYEYELKRPSPAPEVKSAMSLRRGR
jgi:hypothetical protein